MDKWLAKKSFPKSTFMDENRFDANVDIRKRAEDFLEKERMILKKILEEERKIPFEQVINMLKEYKEKYGNVLVSSTFTTEEGIHLGKIVSDITIGNRQINEEEKNELDKLGFVWEG